MKKYLLSIVVCLFFIPNVFSQYDVEALKYSQKFLQSDARSVGLGNAFGAVGANIVSSSINPAGIGVFRSGEISISTSFNNIRTENLYLGNKINKSKFNVNVPQFGLVFSHVNKKNGKEVTEGWAGFTFGFGVIRTNNFNTRYHYSGENTQNSILDYHVERANGKDPNSLGLVTGLYYDAWLIDNPDTNNPYDYQRALDPSQSNLQINQNSILTTKGSMYDINFTFAGNYSNKVYLGGNINFPNINYRKTAEFNEENMDPNRSDYVSSNYLSTLDVNGNGINATFGIIYKPSKYFRLGGSIQTPTYYWLSEDYREQVTSNIIGIDTDPQEAFGSFDYNVTTPMRATASFAFFLGKIGFLSVDYDFVDYSATFYDSDDYAFTNENQAIENNYGTANNVRIGAELRHEIFAIRGGYSLYGSPFNAEIVPDNANGETEVFALGFGIREKVYFIDLAYQIMNRSEYYLPYSLASQDVNGGTTDYKNTNILLTMGLRF
jgi:hypothetical protein